MTFDVDIILHDAIDIDVVDYRVQYQAVGPVISDAVKGPFWPDPRPGDDATFYWTPPRHEPPASPKDGLALHVTAVNLAPQPVTGTGTISVLTFDYSGVAPGVYTRNIPFVELTDVTLWPYYPAPFSIVTTVVAGTPPTLAPPWETAPHATGTGTIDMTASQATDDFSPAGEIQYRFHLDGTPSAWQASRSYSNTGLGVNTQHTYEVQAMDGAGNPTAWLGTTSVYTLANPPAAGGLAAVDDDQVQASWAANGNPGVDTTYVVELYSPSLGGALVATSPATAGLSHTFSGLDPDTTYAARVKALNGDGISTTFTDLGTAVTHAQQPVAVGLLALSDQSIRATWNTGDNPGDTQYLVNWGSSNSGWVTGSSYDATGLDPNALYTFTVKARNVPDGVETGTTALGSTYTHARVPVDDPPAFDPVTESSITANWGANGNPGTTEYEVQCWTPAIGGTLVQTSPTATALSAVFGLLDANKTYAMQVRAFNGDDVPTDWHVLGTVATYANPPGAGGLTALDDDRVQATWTANGNPDVDTTYIVELYTPSLGGSLVATSPATTGVSHTFSGLDPDKTYAARVKALNSDDVPTAFTDLGTAVTHAEQPTAGGVLALSDQSIRASWNPGANPGDTEYLVEWGAGNSGWVTGSSYDATGLSPNTQYAFTVKARNRTDHVETAATALGSTYTHARVPTDDPPAFEPVTESSITANWGANGNPGTTKYEVQCWTPAIGGTLVQTSPKATALSALFGLLDVNTTYAMRVRAFNGDDVPTAWHVLGTVATRANLPGAEQLGPATDVTLQANWDDNGNPVGTQYQAECYTPSLAGTLQATSPWTLSTNYVFSGLSPNVPYAVQVRARNSDAVPTAWVDLGVLHTLARPPLPDVPPFAPITNTSITVNLDPNGNAAGTEYYIECYEGDVIGGSPVAVSGWITSLSHLFGGLTTGQTYTFRAKARNGDDVETGWTDLGTTTTFAQPGVLPLNPITTSSIQANWTSNGNPAGTLYTVERHAGATFGTPADSMLYTADTFAHNFTGLVPNTQHSFRARAKAAPPDTFESSWTDLGTAYTLAVAPTGGAVDGKTSSSIDVSWSNGGGNAAGTPYNVECYVGSVAPGNLVDSRQTAGLTASFGGLSPNTLYVFRVQAENGDGAGTAWLDIVPGGEYTYAAALGVIQLDEVVLEPDGRTLRINAPAARTVGILGILLNGNPADTLIAIRCVPAPVADGPVANGGGWLETYGFPFGRPKDVRPLGADPEYMTAAEWARRLRGLEPGTTYNFYAQAQNGAGEVSPETAVGSWTTNLNCDVNRSGGAYPVTGLDWVYVRNAALLGNDIGIDVSWATDVQDNGMTTIWDMQDVQFAMQN